MGVAVHRRDLSAAARRRACGSSGATTSRTPRPCCSATRDGSGSPGPRRPPWPGCATPPCRRIRRRASAEPGSQSSLFEPRPVPTSRSTTLARGVRRPAAPARRHRAPGPDAAADRRRVGGHAGRRRDEPRRAAVARGRPPGRAARAARRAVRGRRRAAAARRAGRRGVGRVRAPGAARSARRRRQGVRAGRDQGEVDPALGARGDRPSGRGAADRVQEAVPDLDRARLVLAPGLGAGRPVPARVPAGRHGHRPLDHQRRRRAADPQGDPAGRGRRPGLAAGRRRRRPDGAAGAGRDLPRPGADGGRGPRRATSTRRCPTGRSPATAPRPSSPCWARSTARPPATA